MTSRRDQAIVLQAKDYSESDQMVALFLKQGGKRNAMAKGARRSQKRFGAALLEMGSVITIHFKESSQKDWLFLQETSLIDQNRAWRTSWKTIMVAGYWLELVLKTLPEGQESAQKFLLLQHFLSSLKEESAVESLFQFQWDWLSLSGWHPDFKQCGICGKRWKEGEGRIEQAIFDHYWGHILPKPLLSRRLLEKVF